MINPPSLWMLSRYALSCFTMLYHAISFILHLLHSLSMLSLPYSLTLSISHSRYASCFHSVTVSQPYCPTASLSNCLTASLSYSVIVSPSHRAVASLIDLPLCSLHLIPSSLSHINYCAMPYSCCYYRADLPSFSTILTAT